MLVPLLISLAGLLTVACAGLAIVMLESSPVGLPLLLLALWPLLAAVLVVTRHRYAEAFLRMTAMLWVPLGLVVLLPILLGAAEEPPPAWVVPTLVLATIAGIASVVALAAGIRFLRTPA